MLAVNHVRATALTRGLLGAVDVESTTLDATPDGGACMSTIGKDANNASATNLVSCFVVASEELGSKSPLSLHLGATDGLVTARDATSDFASVESSSGTWTLGADVLGLNSSSVIANDGLGSVRCDPVPLHVADVIGTAHEVASNGRVGKSSDDASTVDAEATRVISCVVFTHNRLRSIRPERSLHGTAAAVGTTLETALNVRAGRSSDGKPTLDTDTTSLSFCMSIASDE